MRHRPKFDSRPVSLLQNSKEQTIASIPEYDLRDYGITEEDAAVLREQSASFEDWNAPEMSIYDDYDSAKSLLDSSQGI